MTLGSILIYECPNCEKAVAKQSLLYGNTFNAVYFSDGKRIAPMLPDFPAIVKCKKCNAFFELGDKCEFEGDKEKYAGVEHAEFMSVYEYAEAIDSGFAKSKKEEMYLRQHLWWAFNDRVREEANLFVKDDDKTLYESNCTRLIEMLETERPDKKRMIAELYRNIECYDKCLGILKTIGGEEPEWIKEIAKKECLAKNRNVINYGNAEDIAKKKENIMREKLSTVEEALRAVSCDPEMFEYVPEELRTPEFYLSSIKANSECLRYVPETFKSMEMCLAAVKTNGSALKYVPDELKTFEMCDVAIQSNGFILQYVPDDLKTFDFCLAAVKKCGGAMRFIPKELKTPDFYSAAVKANDTCNEYLPEDMQITSAGELAASLALGLTGVLARRLIATGKLDSHELKKIKRHFAEVESDGCKLKDIPNELITPKMCLAAVESSIDALEYVPEDLKTPELCLIAVKRNGFMLGHVPEKLKTQEMCFSAVKQHCLTLGDVPDDLKTKELCYMAVEDHIMSLRYVPDEFVTPEIYLIAMKANGSGLMYVPDELRTLELCLAAVEQNGSALEEVPDDLRTHEMCLAAVKSNGFALQYVPKELKTEELCLIAVENQGTSLEYVPEELKTRKVCLVALEGDEDALEYVPEELKAGKRLKSGLGFMETEEEASDNLASANGMRPPAPRDFTYICYECGNQFKSDRFEQWSGLGNKERCSCDSLMVAMKFKDVYLCNHKCCTCSIAIPRQEGYWCNIRYERVNKDTVFKTEYQIQNYLCHIYRENCNNACETACPVNAIAKAKDGVKIIPSKCVDCLTCIYACPVGAIKIKSNGV